MIYGAIDEKSCKHYTDIYSVLSSMRGKQNDYNWLITDSEIIAWGEDLNKLNTHQCYFEIDGKLTKCSAPEYKFLSGEELIDIVEKDRGQWIWGVLSAFEKNIKLEEILKYPLPFSDGNGDLWKNPVSLQNPLASVEIVPFDSGLVLFKSREKELVNLFRKAFPLSEDLAKYNARYQN